MAWGGGHVARVATAAVHHSGGSPAGGAALHRRATARLLGSAAASRRVRTSAGGHTPLRHQPAPYRRLRHVAAVADVASGSCCKEPPCTVAAA